MSMSNYLENKVLNHILAGTSYTAPTKLYVALFTSNPGEDLTGAEVTGGAYARQVVSFNVATAGTSISEIDALFPVATATWGTVTHVGIMDAATGGNLLFYNAITTSKSVSAEDQIKIAAGSMTISLD
ncbi:phage tail fiber protein [Paenibacillus sp. NPDC093718]|uniref:phage tail fiber protein n=1 Tax=Paenibacillus sp. NPDC093718 TaxID=3390601 RepID=UPI003D0019B3